MLNWLTDKLLRRRLCKLRVQHDPWTGVEELVDGYKAMQRALTVSEAKRVITEAQNVAAETAVEEAKARVLAAQKQARGQEGKWRGN